ncbi:MAG: flagellar basal body P-ring formation protein FlgA [Sedimentisphaerales bacterium]|nr:flagellar basal body P-ring formation protein FlgA [Sedimentisphaerales bacterium]
MKNKRLFGLILLLVLLQSVFVLGRSDTLISELKGLRIYLPREAQVKKDLVTLGDIAVVKGQETLADRASSIVLGRFSMPFQTIGLSRAMISGRLASEGFVDEEVQITGADKIVITKQNTVLKADELIKAAKSYLKENVQSESVGQIEPVGLVKDIELPAYLGSVELVPALMESGSAGKAKVNIAIMSGEQKISEQQIEFRLGYVTRQIAATRDIRRGESLTPDNVQVTEEISQRQQSSQLQQPYGLIARRAIYAGNVITNDMVDSPDRKVLVKRNENVAVMVKKPGLFIQAMGMSLEDGRVGDFIKVRMQISSVSRVIYAQVKLDGTVEPLM